MEFEAPPPQEPGGRPHLDGRLTVLDVHLVGKHGKVMSAIMAAKKVPHEAVEHAVAQVARGHSLRDVEAELSELGVNVSRETIRSWCKRAADESRPVFVPPSAAAVVVGEATTLMYLLEGDEPYTREDLADCWRVLSESMAEILAELQPAASTPAA